MKPAADDATADSLDVLIEQERQLIKRFEDRQGSADTTAAAAITGVVALAALIAGAAKSSHVNKPFAWVVVIALALVTVIALTARFVAGLHVDYANAENRSQGTDTPPARPSSANATTFWAHWFPRGLTSRSEEYKLALDALREIDATKRDAAVEVREKVLAVCRARARDAEEAAEAKERWAAFSTLGLALAVALSGSFALSLI